jgi:hypothetical protein
MIWEELRRHKTSSLGMPKASQVNISRSLKHLSLGMPRLASHLSSSTTIGQFWLSLSFCFFTWYVFCLERHFILFVFACCYLKQCFASFVSIKMSSRAFTMLSLQVYVLLFENRKFSVMSRIFLNSQNMKKIWNFTQEACMSSLSCGNFSEFFELCKYGSCCILYRLFCLDRLLLWLHCLHMLACLVVLFKDKSIKYAEAFSMHC